VCVCVCVCVCVRRPFAPIFPTGVSVRKKTVAIFRELFLSGSLNPQFAAEGQQRQLSAPPFSAAPTLHVLQPVLLPEANSRTVRALLTLLQRNTDPREEESIRDALQSMFDEIWFGLPRAAQRGRRTDALIHAAQSGGGGGSASLKALSSKDVAPPVPSTSSTAQQLVAAELAQRTSQLASLVDSTISSSRGAEWLSELLKRLLAPAAPSGAAAGAVAVGALPVKSVRAPAPGPVVPGIGPWSALAAAGAFVSVLVESLKKLNARRAELVALDVPDQGRGSDRASAVSESSAQQVQQPPKSGAALFGEARALYEREVVAALAALKAFAQASPALLSPHVHVLAPYLRGDPLLLSPTGCVAVQLRTASILELVIPACSPAADSTLVDAVVADLVRLLKVSSLS
jgi:hypothetical protein